MRHLTTWLLFGFVLTPGASLVALAACNGGAGSSLTACPSPNDITPGDTCANGQSCPSTAALPDCPGSLGSVVCSCTGSGWSCADPNQNPCVPEADGASNDGSDEPGDDGGDGQAEGAQDEGGQEDAADTDAAPDASDEAPAD